ncbi:unnamed protein product [Staurois parvus]|uniref:Uncharacterized protein n=1 Tax=Staurois parvus TaxID=386267 RepID=A0ABN9AU19_9NEOB|nr:unnamed protein product [Staurois parvus]
MPPQCLLVHINATYQCPSDHQCHLSVPVSATYQCQSVPPISVHQCHLSMPISVA